MKIVWSPTAVRHFSGWIGFIAEGSARRAEAERVAILKAVGRLKKHPRSGRMVPEFGNPSLREVIKRPIRIIYQVCPGRIEILALHHSKRLFNLRVFS